ncbi:MAG: ribonuclease III family protein [Solirubrobacteraceae bacterium]
MLLEVAEQGGRGDADTVVAGDAEPASRTDAKREERVGEGGVALLEGLLTDLPAKLERQVFTHASWSERRGDSYTRLAFLGDSVLALAVTTHLYPRLEADRFGAGRLTKIRAQAVSGSSCRAVAERLRLADRLRAAAPTQFAVGAVGMLETERVLASVIEAVIGACYLHAGYERTAEAVVQAFTPEIDEALEHPLDFKSTLQELLAQRGELVSYEVISELGAPHARTFTVAATVNGETIGSGEGRTKKIAEQLAAREAVQRLQEG